MVREKKEKESSRVSLFHWPNGKKGTTVRTDGKVPFGKAAKRVRSIKKRLLLLFGGVGGISRIGGGRRRRGQMARLFPFSQSIHGRRGVQGDPIDEKNLKV